MEASPSIAASAYEPSEMSHPTACVAFVPSQGGMPLDVVAEDVCPAASNTSKSCGDLIPVVYDLFKIHETQAMPPGLTLPDTTVPLAGGEMPCSLANSTGAAIPAVMQPQVFLFKALADLDDAVFEGELIDGIFAQQQVPLNLEGVEKGQRKEMLHNSLCARPLTVSAAPLPHHP